MTMGTGLCLDPLELRHSKLIIIWASNTRLTNRHLWPTIDAARADGARLIVIDPLRTVTADAADWFLQPLPGTDTALCLALMHVLIHDTLVDQPWIDAHTLGFDKPPPTSPRGPRRGPRRSAGSEAAGIERLATEYGTVRPAAIRTLIGGEHHENGAMFYRTLGLPPGAGGCVA